MLYPCATNHELVRLGPMADGGYLVPDDLDDIIACFSPGVDKISEFELDCSKRGMELFLADASVDGPGTTLPAESYHFLKKYIGPSTFGDFITLDDWVESSDLPTKGDLLLQMDIEGAEYFSLLNVSDGLLQRFRIIVIEFHDLDQLWNEYFFRQAEAVFEKLLHTHTCVHQHPNNHFRTINLNGISIPRLNEFTFYRNDRIKKKEYQTEFPNPLDADNTSKPTLVLPSSCYFQGNKSAL